jgi:ABC-type nitrate/sulfonate/bicarbonate transport system substrate-binding protein
LPYARFLTDLYGTVLVTSAETAQKNPGLARDFATALIAGTRYAVEHPDYAGQAIHAAVAADDPTVTAQVMTAMRPYVGDGRLDAARVMRGIAVLESAGMIKQDSLESEQLVAFNLMPEATVG